MKRTQLNADMRSRARALRARGYPFSQIAEELQIGITSAHKLARDVEAPVAERDPGPNPDGLCMCGCGRRTSLARSSNAATGKVRGRPMRFIRGHQARSRDVPATGYEVDHQTGCWIWLLSVSGQGYGKAGDIQAHRAVYERLVGPIPEGMQLDHLCRNRRCVNPEHLEPVTPAENTRRGDSAKLTVTDVCEIRASAESRRVLADRFGVTEHNVYRIQRGLSWRDVA